MDNTFVLLSAYILEDTKKHKDKKYRKYMKIITHTKDFEATFSNNNPAHVFEKNGFSVKNACEGIPITFLQLSA